MDTHYKIIISFVIGASVSFFLLMATWLLNAKTYRLQRILAAIMIFLAIMTGKDMLFVLPDGYSQQNLNWVFVADGWMAIAYAVFLFELSSSGWTTPPRIALLSAPFAVFTGLYYYYREDWVIAAYTGFLCVFGIVVLIEASRRVCKYMRYVRSEYSNLDNINLSWFWNIITLFFLLQLVWLFISKAAKPIMDVAYYALYIVFWGISLYQCKKLRPVLVPKECDEMEEDIQNYPFDDKFMQMIETDQVYREHGLRLDHLAKRLGTNRTYLGMYFRNVLHTTFYDYINRMRIEKIAIPMINDHPEYKLEHVAKESGFSSISTFRRAFKKVTGMLPTEYQRDD